MKECLNCMTITEQYKSLMKKCDYHVTDLAYTESSVLFILESPHKDELRNKYPLSGVAGKQASKMLLGKDISLGEYSKNNRIISIMNVSTVPLQKAAYNGLPDCLSDLYVQLERMRVSPKRKKRSNKYKNVTDLEELIQYNYNKRLYGFLSSANNLKRIVVCGNVADSFYKDFPQRQYLEKNYIINKLPHPARHGWAEYFCCTLCLIRNEIEGENRGQIL